MEPTEAPQSTDFDPAALIEQHQAGLWRYLRALGCEATQAEDFVQDTFVSVLQKPFNHYSPAATAAYLRTVARNFFISAQRRAGKVIAVETVEEVDTTWEDWGGDDHNDDMLEALRDCMSRLTDRARMALEMRFREKATRQDIAEALEISPDGAKNLMQRAKKQLKTCVESKIQE